MSERTLYSKYSLAVAGVASKDAKDILLHRVHFDPDGSAVASNGRAFMAVSPPLPNKAATFPDLDEGNAAPPKEGIGVVLEDVARIKRNFPTDRRPSLQYAQMIRCTKIAVSLMTTDGRTSQVVKGQPARGTFPKWKGIIAKARRNASKARFCVDRKSLSQALDAIDKACPDKGGYNPVFIEVGTEEDSIILRAHNYESGQTAIAMVTPLSTTVGWLEDSEWEKENFSGKVKARRIK